MSDQQSQLPPPSGDSEQADKYISQLIDLISTDKLSVSHTDLAKFDPTSLQDHYRMDLTDYEVEVSHNKQADSGQDSYVMLFNNLKYVNEKCTEKIILAYMHLNEDQFRNFKSVADEQLERKRRAVEQKRFKEAMAPMDQMLNQLANSDEKNQSPPDDTQATPLDNPSENSPPAFASP